MEKLKKILKNIKPIFLSGVILLIVLEFGKLRKEISLEEISRIFYEINLIKIFAMAILGFVSFLPMLGYDFLLKKFLKINRDKKYIVKRSITINSFNNLIGFGGVINLGLRMRYFGEEKEDKHLFEFLVKSLLFDLAGISFLAIISLIFLLISKSKILINYKIWLIGGVLYYPVLFLASKIRNDGEFAISKKYAAEVSLVSFLEWLGACLFFIFIGFVLGIKVKFFNILSIFVIANIIGIASFMPGSIGSFDLVALAALTSVGVKSEVVFSWILLYRIFYYIIPFAIGFLFFMEDLGSVFDEKKDNIPSKIIKSLGLDLSSTMLYITGAFMIISTTIPDELGKFQWLKNFSPLHANLIYQFPSLFFGFSFIILGRSTREKVKRTTKVTLIYLVLALTYSILSGFGFIEMFFIIILIFLTITTRKIPHREQLVYSSEAVTTDMVILGIISIVTIYFMAINYKLKPINPKDFFIVPFENSFLHFVIVFTLLIVSASFLSRYLKGKRIKLGEKMDPEKILSLLEIYDSHPESGLALVGDKEIYYYKDEEVATCGMSIYTYKDKIIVMGEPFGNKEDFDKLLDKFIRDADTYGYSPIFYEIGEKQTIKLHDYGFSFLKFGETANIELEKFSLEGKKHKMQRKVLSKFERNNYTFEVLKPTYDEEFLNKLENISANWLGDKKERGFSLGYFDRDYLKFCDMAVVRDEDKNILAFANIMPNPNSVCATIDLMRYKKDENLDSIMEYLLLKLTIYFKEQGKKYFEIGMAPLSNVGINTNSFVEEKVAYLIYKFGYKFYSFEGLRAYKEKFSPTWDPVYLSYPNKTWILNNMIAIFIVDIVSVKYREK